MYDDITAIILSGGKSSRMGTNKSLLKIGDKTVIERMRDLLQSMTQLLMHFVWTHAMELQQLLVLPVVPHPMLTYGLTGILVLMSMAFVLEPIL